MKKTGFYIVLLLLHFYSCSTERNAFPNKAYHSVTTRYNVYFNGNEKLKAAEEQLYKTHVDDYEQVLAVFPYGTEDNAKSVTSLLEVAIKKSSKAIDRHSMRFKIKRKGETKAEETEVNPFIDDSYFILGKSYFLKQDFSSAKETFDYMAKEYSYKKSKHKALLWLIKSHVALGEYKNAQQIINLVENENKMPKKYKSEYYAAKAQYYLKTNDTKEAITALQQAVTLSKKGKFKSRWNYILAQLHLQQGNTNEALALFKKVAEKSYKYEMEFNARINMAQAASGEKSPEELAKDLLKLTKDPKNSDYLDQIYFAIGNIYLKNDQKDKASENFLLAAQNSVNNPKQKALAYLAVANLNFEKLNYVAASAYYDSTLSVLPASHAAYEETKTKQLSLTEIVKQIEIIHTEDSLQKLASMPEAQRLKAIDKLIADEIEKEDRAKEKELLKQEEADRQSDAPVQLDEGAKWYFYNPSTLASGKSKFTSVWGNRKLEDNWRRKNKESSSFGAENIEENQNTVISNQRDKTKTRDHYLKALPLSEEAMRTSREKSETAYFTLGLLYKDNLEDVPSAIKTFEEMNLKYPNNKNALKSYYLLYRGYLSLGKTDKANYYKNLIESNYPNSEYAVLINKKGNSQEEENQLKQLNAHYEKLLIEYKKANYASVINEANSIKNTHKNNKLEPQFELLKAFAIGQTKGAEEFKKELLLIISAYPGSDAAINAEEIIKGSQTEEIKKANTTEKYKIDKTEEHYFVILADEVNSDVNSLQKAIANYSTQFFGLENLKVETMVWEGSTKMVLVKSFFKTETTLSYHKTLYDKVLVNYPNVGDNYFSISVSNFPVLLQEKNIAHYHDFFLKTYLTEGK